VSASIKHSGRVRHEVRYRGGRQGWTAIGWRCRGSWTTWGCRSTTIRLNGIFAWSSCSTRSLATCSEIGQENGCPARLAWSCQVTAEAERAAEGEAHGFLVEFEVNVPDGTPAAEVKDRQSAEASAAAKLADQGHLVRVWNRPDAAGDTTLAPSTMLRLPPRQ
jgi:hypothetical protein